MIVNPKISEIKLEPLIGFDLETSGLYAWLHKIIVIAVSTSKTTYVLDTRKYSKQELDELFKRISECTVIGQNIKFDCNFVYYHHNILFRDIWDTMLAEQVLTNGLPNINYDLVSIIRSNLGVLLYEDPKIKKFYQLSFTTLRDTEELSKGQIEYAGSDTKYLIEVYNKQYDRISKLKLDRVMELEHRVLPVLSKIEVIGCRFDKLGLERCLKGVWIPEQRYYQDLLDAEVNRLSENNSVLLKKYGKGRNRQVSTVYSLFDAPSEILVESSSSFNYSSSAEIIELFKLLSLPVPVVDCTNQQEPEVKTAFKLGDKWKKYSVGEDVLRLYITEHTDTPLREFIRLLLKYREYSKLISVYGEDFLAKIDSRGYIHTSYTQCYTDTGRLSSSNPNLQNIPAMDDKEIEYLLKKYNIQCEIRSFFLPDEGDIMLTSDMNAAEVRLAADYSQEPKLIDSIIRDEDLHSKLASVSYSIIFGKKVKINKSKDQLVVSDKKYTLKTLRDNHKSVLFAKFYKGGAKRVYDVLAEYINAFWKGEEAVEISRKISKAIDKQLPVLSKYLTSLIDKAKTDGFLIGSVLGRIRYFDKDKVYGEAANYPIQNSNGEAMKIALVNADKYLTNNDKGRIVLTVHDELAVTAKIHKSIFEVRTTYRKIKQIMADSLGYFLGTIQGDASVGMAYYWKK